MIGLVIAALFPPAVSQDAHRFEGPATVCGAAFAITLRKGESLEWGDNGMDFIAYHFTHLTGVTVIYEGNHPEDGGVVRETGRGWPAKVVVHGPEVIANRLDMSTRGRLACVNRKPG